MFVIYSITTKALFRITKAKYVQTKKLRFVATRVKRLHRVYRVCFVDNTYVSH